MAASQDKICLVDQEVVPQWKRELILRRRALSRTLVGGSSSVQLTCPSVVAAVRQAESPPQQAAAGEHVSGNPQRCILASNWGLLDQTQADFHPVPVSVSPTVGLGENMRLVEADPAPGSRKTNGVGLESNSLIDPVKYRSIMGEEKSVKKSCASNRKMDNLSAIKGIGLVLGKSNCNHSHDEECQSDSSEELQYGPGIVKKLKSKYMSMTLRESKNKGVRPSLSNLRRATSLENMLDNDETETGKPPLIKPQHKFTKRTEATNNSTNKSQYSTQHQQRYRSVSRGNDPVKRARSVEALLRYEVKPPASQVSSPMETKLLLRALSRDELIIVEKNSTVTSDEKPPIPQSITRSKKRPIMNPQQKSGLPPSDVVKQTLKLFENSQSKIVAATAKVNGGPLTKLNINLANQNKPSAVLNKPLLSPKPSPEKIRRGSPLGKIHSPKRAQSPTSASNSVSTVPIVEVVRKVPSLSTTEVPLSVPMSPAMIEIQEKVPVSFEENNILPSPTIPSRVLPLDLKPTKSVAASFLSSPKLKTPSPIIISPTKTVLSPTNGVAKSIPSVPPFVSPRSSSPVSKLPPSPVTQPPISKLPTSLIPQEPSPVSKLPPVPEPSPVSKLSTAPVQQQKSTSPTLRPRSSSPIIKARTPSPVSRVRSPSPASRPVTNGKLKPTVSEGSSEDDDTVTDGCVNKSISRSSLENIRKGGSTVQFSFCNNVSAGDKSKSHLPGDQSGSGILSVPVVSKVIPKAVPLLDKRVTSPSSRQHPNPMSPLPGMKSPDSSAQIKQVGIIRPIVNSKMQSPSPLTDREIEKNLINRVKSCPPVEQPTKVVASLKPSEIVVGNVSDSLKNLVGADEMSNRMKDVKSLRDTVNSNGTGLWDHKRKPWNQQQNTLVFNFSDRKDPVPDYIENDGMNMRGKREKIRPGDSGYIQLDPSLEESSTDCENDDFYCGGPPSPCNVHFEGDNILINGKSNLRRQPRQRKLRITFDDQATRLYEYPSESSLLNDLLNSSPPGPSAAAAAAAAAGLPGPSAAIPIPSGGNSLASYTSKVSQGADDFQLGVSRTTPLPKPKEASETTGAVPSLNESDNVAWSTDTADDLLF